MINIQELRTEEHPFKKIFKTHNISIGMLAKYLDRSYPYVCSMLSGVYTMPFRIEEQLQVLVNQLEGTEGFTS